MKVNICDACVMDKKLALAKYRVKHKTGITVALCMEHRRFTDAFSAEQFLDFAIKSESSARQLEKGESK